MTEQEFLITFEPPEHGWLNIAIKTPCGEYFIDASDVPCNSLEQLASALQEFQQHKPSKIEWSLEPGFAVWKLTPNGEQSSFEVFDTLDEKVLHIICSHKDMFNKLLNFMDAVGKSESWLTPHHWSWDFPKNELRELTEQVKLSGTQAIR